MVIGLKLSGGPGPDCDVTEGQTAAQDIDWTGSETFGESESCEHEPG